MTGGLSLVLASSFAASAAIVYVVRGLARRRDWLDVPNGRSSHAVPTPVGGGLGILFPFLVGMSLTPVMGLAPHLAWPSVVAVALVALVAWIDDVQGLGIGVRLLVHGVGGAILATVALDLAPAPFGLVLAPGLVFAWWTFWGVAVINVVNFMDGSDALIGLQAVVYGGFALLAGWGSDPIETLAVVLTGGAIAFLVFNRPPATIFLGDVGSATVAAGFLVLGILTIPYRSWTAFHAFLPLMPLFVDATTTMLRRLARGERIWQAHRSHLYQLLIRRGWSHGAVAILYAAMAGGCAYWALAFDRLSSTFIVGAVTILTSMVFGMEISRTLLTSGSKKGVTV